MSLNENHTQPTVALLIYEGIGPFHLAGPVMVFGENGVNTPLVNMQPFSIQGNKVKTCSGFEINVPNDISFAENADAIIIPGWTHPNNPIPVCIKQLLIKANNENRHVVGLCRGSFVLAEAGILNGKRATTHWLLADSFSDRYPLVNFDNKVSYCRDGNIWTAAGGTASIDICLLMLESLVSKKEAASLIKNIIYGLPAPKINRTLKSGINLSKMNMVSTVHTRVLEILSYLQSHPTAAIRLDELAAQANISSRTLTRKFKEITGLTVTQWHINQQISYAKQLLTTTNAKIELIASQVGFNSALALRKNFVKATGMTPTEYRKNQFLI